MTTSAAAHSNSPRLPGVPRYLELAETLQHEIENETHAVGSRLPTEQALCDRFNVSRFTVREALRRLADKGMVVRRQGSGTHVASRNPVTRFVQELHSFDELLQYSLKTRLKVIDAQDMTVDADIAGKLRCRPSEKWHKIETIRYLDAKSPVCWTDIYIHPEHQDIVNQIGQDATPVFSLFEQMFGLRAESVTMELFAGALSNRRAQALGAEPGSPSLVVVRRFQNAEGNAFEISISEHPAGRFTFSLNLERNSKANPTAAFIRPQ